MSTKKKAPKAEKAPEVKVNKFGVPLFIDKSSKTQLRERVNLLKEVVEKKHPIGSDKTLSENDIKRAEMHIRWYSAELRKLAAPKKNGRAS